MSSEVFNSLHDSLNSYPTTKQIKPTWQKPILPWSIQRGSGEVPTAFPSAFSKKALQAGTLSALCWYLELQQEKSPTELYRRGKSSRVNPISDSIGSTYSWALSHTSAGKPPHAPAWTQEQPGTAVTSLSLITLLRHPHQLLHSACFPENQSCYPTGSSNRDKRGVSQSHLQQLQLDTRTTDTGKREVWVIVFVASGHQFTAYSKCHFYLYPNNLLFQPKEMFRVEQQTQICSWKDKNGKYTQPPLALRWFHLTRRQ